MKNYPQTHKKRLEVDINLALYANLILILMSILLITIIPLFQSPLSLHEIAKMKASHPITTPIIITMKPDGSYHVNTEIKTEESMSWDTMQEALLKQFKMMQPQETSICIQSDPNTPYGKVIEIVDWLQAQGAQHVGLLTKPSAFPEPS